MVPARRLSVLAFLFLCFAATVGPPALAGKLTDAVKLRDVALVRSLLAAGEDVQEKVKGDYPLNVAALYGPVEMVNVLLEGGADIERPSRDGLRPLHNAVLSGRKEAVKLLLQKGAVVDSKENWGRTPLLRFAASAGSDIEIARMLLAAGADPGIEDEELDQPLHYAAQIGNIELGKLLIAAHVDVNHAGIDGWSAILAAVVNSHHEFVKLLITAGADINVTRGPQGNRPLFYARDDAMRKLLIDAGAK